MSEAPQGLFEFDGIESVAAGVFPFNAHGITPSVCTLDIAPQENLSIIDGTLRIKYDTINIAFPGCRIDSHSRDRYGSGVSYRIRILDRRWRWRFGQISGEYNRRSDNNQVHPVLGTARSPQQLAELCLRAAGEQNFDVSELPNLARPEISWDREVPMEALSQLVESLGCRVVLDPIDNKVLIKRAGVGKKLDDDDRMSDSAGTDGPELPARLVVSTDPVRLQVDLLLSPVGLDTNGQIVKLDNLSYTPVRNGRRTWEGYNDLLHFAETLRDHGKAACEAARQSVYRWYRIVTPINTLRYGQIDFLASILPIEDRLIEVVRGTNGNFERAPAFVYGVWAQFMREDRNRMDAGNPRVIGQAPIERRSPLAQLFEQQLTAADRETIVGSPLTLNAPNMSYEESRYRPMIPAPDIGYSIDLATGIVRFSNVCQRLDTDGKAQAAHLVLRCTIMVHRGVTREPIRQELVRNLGGPAGDHVIKRADIQPGVILQYEIGAANQLCNDNGDPISVPWQPNPIGFLAENTSHVAEQGAHYLDEAEKLYQPVESRIVTYAGFKAIHPDGAIRQITWTIDHNGATTTAAYNADQTIYTRSYAEQRKEERIAALLRDSEIRRQQAAGAALRGTGL